jgi:hypothetical protein
LSRWQIDIASSAVLNAMDAKMKRLEWRQTWGLLFIALGLIKQEAIEDEDEGDDSGFIDLS